MQGWLAGVGLTVTALVLNACGGQIAPGAGTGPDAEAGNTIASSNDVDGASAASSNDGGGAPAGPSLVVNGDFTQGVSFWGFETPPPGGSEIAVRNGDLCVTAAAAGSPVTVIWPTVGYPGASLSSSKTYTLSYGAVVKETVPMDVKVGAETSPDFEAQNDVVGTSLRTFTHTFVPPRDDGDAGLEFTFTIPVKQPICFAAISLVAR
jgi:hypothetical protein